MVTEPVKNCDEQWHGKASKNKQTKMAYFNNQLSEPKSWSLLSLE